LTSELLEKGLAVAPVATVATVVPVAPAAVATVVPEPKPNRRRKTRDAPGNRIVTPIKTHRRFAFTRKGQGQQGAPKGVSL
jgi:hypothetical protein